MIEIDLFNKTVESAIRAEQSAYLRKVRSQPFEQDLPEVEEVSAEAFAKMKCMQRIRYRLMIRKQRKAYRKALRMQKCPVDELLTKGYNAGVEAALKVLAKEYTVFIKSLENSDKL